MLVLSRRESESLIINENIVVTIIRIAGGGVRLGIEAPREIPVQREELAVRYVAAKECLESCAGTN